MMLYLYNVKKRLADFGEPKQNPDHFNNGREFFYLKLSKQD